MTAVALDPVVVDRLARDAHAGPKATGRGTSFSVTTQHPISSYAAEQVLRAGGTAADALVTMVSVDCVVVPGTSVLGGTMGALFHEASTGTTYSINAGLDRPRGDTMPFEMLSERESGRAVLVPGTVGGLESIWQRFGSMPWADLWAPAIQIASEGFRTYPLWDNCLRRRADVVLRHEGGRDVFDPLPPPESVFRQPALSRTLSAIAEQGAGWMYTGGWAAKLVTALRSLGGRMSMDDLAAYQVRWQEPLVGSYLGRQVRTCAPPHYCGASLLFALNVAEALELHTRPRRDEAADVLYDEIQVIKRALALSEVRVDPEVDKEAMDAFGAALSKERARAEADAIRAGRPASPSKPVVLGSHGVGAVDSAGNMVVATHTTEADAWGDTGVFIDGVACNSAMYTTVVHDTRPGHRVCEPLSAYLVMDGERPLFAASPIGSGLLGCNLQNTVNVVGHGMGLGESIAANRFGYFEFDLSTYTIGEAVQIEPFAGDVLDGVEALGQPLCRREVRADQRGGHAYADTGYWAAVGFDPATGDKLAVTDPRLMGRAAGG